MEVLRMKESEKAKMTDKEAENVLKESAAEWFLLVLSLLMWGGMVYFIATQDFESCFPFPALIFLLLAMLLDCVLLFRLLIRHRDSS